MANDINLFTSQDVFCSYCMCKDKSCTTSIFSLPPSHIQTTPYTKQHENADFSSKNLNQWHWFRPPRFIDLKPFQLQRDLSNVRVHGDIANWMTVNRLILNAAKTKNMQFNTARKWHLAYSVGSEWLCDIIRICLKTQHPYRFQSQYAKTRLKNSIQLFHHHITVM